MAISRRFRRVNVWVGSGGTSLPSPQTQYSRRQDHGHFRAALFRGQDGGIDRIENLASRGHRHHFEEAMPRQPSLRERSCIWRTGPARRHPSRFI